MRRCPWRLGYGSPPPLLQGARDGRVSLREFDAVRRDGPRYEPSPRQSAHRPAVLVIGRVQPSLEEASGGSHSRVLATSQGISVALDVGKN